MYHTICTIVHIPYLGNSLTHLSRSTIDSRHTRLLRLTWINPHSFDHNSCGPIVNTECVLGQILPMYSSGLAGRKEDSNAVMLTLWITLGYCSGSPTLPLYCTFLSRSLLRVSHVSTWCGGIASSSADVHTIKAILCTVVHWWIILTLWTTIMQSTDKRCP